jgi:hypothetical protein
VRSRLDAIARFQLRSRRGEIDAAETGLQEVTCDDPLYIGRRDGELPLLVDCDRPDHVAAVSRKARPQIGTMPQARLVLHAHPRGSQPEDLVELRRAGGIQQDLVRDAPQERFARSAPVRYDDVRECALHLGAGKPRRARFALAPLPSTTSGRRGPARYTAMSAAAPPPAFCRSLS